MSFAPHSTVAELLDDTLIQAVMRADRVQRGELEILLTDTAAKLAQTRRSRALTFHPSRVRFLGEKRPAEPIPVAPRAWDCEPCFCR